MNRLKVLAVVGPTGVGKTVAAAAVCRLFNGEIISADSMQVYLGMDIGTDKASKTLRDEIPHHLIDVVEITEQFSVARFQQMAREAVMDIAARGRLPVVAGGSGLYVRAVLDPLEFPDGQPGTPLRRRLEAEGDEEREALWERLRSLDPDAAAKIPPQNVRRVIRALEINEAGGGLFSDHQRGWSDRESIYDAFMIGLTMDRGELYARIEKRVDRMVKGGLLSEAEGLLDRNIEQSATARQALGYKEMIGYLKGDYTFEDAVTLIKQRSRQFAKRQMTWFKADPRINWIDVGNMSAEDLAGAIIQLVSSSGFIVR